MDLLVRSLLLRPDAPAVIMLGHFAPQTQGEYGFSGPELYHSAVAQFYDVPYLRSVVRRLDTLTGAVSRACCMRTT